MGYISHGVWGWGGREFPPTLGPISAVSLDPMAVWFWGEHAEVGNRVDKRSDSVTELSSPLWGK